MVCIGPIVLRRGEAKNAPAEEAKSRCLFATNTVHEETTEYEAGAMEVMP